MSMGVCNDGGVYILLWAFCIVVGVYKFWWVFLNMAMSVLAIRFTGNSFYYSDNSFYVFWRFIFLFWQFILLAIRFTVLAIRFMCSGKSFYCSGNSCSGNSCSRK
jgi:hypothetical protein